MATRKQWTTARITHAHDKRIKLTDDDKARILALYAQGVAVREIARQFEGVCSRRAVQFIIFPERLAIVHAQYKDRRKDGRYYAKEKNTKAQQDYRKHLREVNEELNQGQKHGYAIREYNARRKQCS